MRPKKPKTTAESDLFRARLDQIINSKHDLVQLGAKIDWNWIDRSRDRATPIRDRAVAAQAHLRPVRRGAVRALGLRPVFPALNW